MLIWLVYSNISSKSNKNIFKDSKVREILGLENQNLL